MRVCACACVRARSLQCAFGRAKRARVFAAADPRDAEIKINPRGGFEDGRVEKCVRTAGGPLCRWRPARARAPQPGTLSGIWDSGTGARGRGNKVPPPPSGTAPRAPTLIIYEANISIKGGTADLIHCAGPFMGSGWDADSNWPRGPCPAGARWWCLGGAGHPPTSPTPPPHAGTSSSAELTYHVTQDALKTLPVRAYKTITRA